MERASKRTARATKLAATLAQLEQLTPDQLRQAWQEQEGAAPPNVSAPLLRRLLAQRMQERQLGGLPAAVSRELARMEQDPVPAAPTDVAPVMAAAALMPGTRLIREWQGRMIAVLAGEDGFVWEDRS